MIPSEDHRLAVVTVNYGSNDDTRRLVESLVRLENSDRCRIIVVNNGATNETVGELNELAEHHPIDVLHVEENLHYWGAAAFALERMYPDPQRMPEWVVVCNNDTEVADRFFLNKLFAYDPTRYHVIAPAVLSMTTGRDQNPFLRTGLGVFERFKWKLYFSSYQLARLLLLAYWGRLRVERLLARRRPALSARTNRVASRIYAPHGAWMIFSREYFRLGGKLDRSFRMYGEEITTAEIAKRIGAAVYYCPDLCVFHREHATMGTRLTRAKYQLEREAYRYFCEEYFHPEGGDTHSASS